MGLEQLELIFSGNSFSDEDAIRLIFDVLEDEKGGSPSFLTHETVLGRADIERQVKATGRFPTDMHSAGLEFRFGVALGKNHRFLIISDEFGPSERWNKWISMAAKNGEFVLAWATNREFDFWQNAHDPIEYKCGGREYENLPMISNGLPPPLDGDVVDTSRNPGRRVLRNGYVEGVGYKMWLSRLFWTYVGRERDDEVLATAGWRLMPMPDGMLEIEVPAEVFTEQGDPSLQARLRSAVYGS